MSNRFAACDAVLDLDVGKSSHWACLVTKAGEVAANRPVANAEAELDELFSQVGAGTLVVVDQVRNIGALAIGRARLAGLEVAYLPGLAAHQAAKLFAGDAKTVERDAMVTAKTALGIPDSLLPVPVPDARLDAARSLAARLDAARSLAAQRSHLVACATRDKNRQSGTSISSVGASRQGNRRLKGLLIFSCNSLIRSDNRFGEYYRRCRGRGMCHGEALKAVARKRLKVIYAIMRDKVPYAA